MPKMKIQTGDISYILLYIDNSKITLDSVMEEVKKSINRSENEQIKAVRRYIIGKAVSDLLRVKDRIQAQELSKQLYVMRRSLTEEQQKACWKEIFQHYSDKVLESVTD